VTARVKGTGRAGRETGFSTASNFSTGASFSLDIERSTGGVLVLLNCSGCGLSRPPSNRAASDAVLSGRVVPCVELDILRVGEGMFRVGDGGCSGAVAVPRVFSQDGGFCEALLVVDCRRLACEGVVGVSFGFSGELLGVEGRTVDGEPSRMEPGRRKGDWRGLLKERGDGLYGVGVVDCVVLASRHIDDYKRHTMMLRC
jgi:hypothetical protein